jgi:hypothetical protein
MSGFSITAQQGLTASETMKKEVKRILKYLDSSDRAVLVAYFHHLQNPEYGFWAAVRDVARSGSFVAVKLGQPCLFAGFVVLLMWCIKDAAVEVRRSANSASTASFLGADDVLSAAPASTSAEPSPKNERKREDEKAKTSSLRPVCTVDSMITCSSLLCAADSGVLFEIVTEGSEGCWGEDREGHTLFFSRYGEGSLVYTGGRQDASRFMGAHRRSRR